jgi:hypothetical protein
MNDATLAWLTDVLWPDGDTLRGRQVHWLLDGARDPRIVQLVRRGGLEHACLFAGRLDPRLQAAAPYLVHLAAGSATTNRLLREGWGRSWGVLTVAPAHVTLQQQRLHLKKLLRVQTEEGAVLAFRFYDPRVLNLYLPSCTDAEWQAVLGPLDAFVAEARGGAGLRMFGRADAAIRTRDLAVGGPLPFDPHGDPVHA